MSQVRRLEKRIEALDHEVQLPGWMRGMECLFGKGVVYELLELAKRQLAESKTAEEINEAAWREVHMDHSGSLGHYCLREALEDREWFMRNGKAEDALRRLCGLKGEVTIQSLEQRKREVLQAIEEQNARIDAAITRRRRMDKETVRTFASIASTVMSAVTLAILILHYFLRSI